MDLLIKGMEMPKEGHLIIRIYASGEVCEPTECAGVWCKVATAVPVPPHGDLIDVDALCKKLEWAAEYAPYLDGPFNAAIGFALLAPTIIPASQEEEHGVVN